ncbi:GmrSD restriction endonuclease domain-containing protein [Acinetobacter sp. NigerLNRRAM0016]
MSENNELELKPINDLLDLSFYIPAYQRGYRWTKRQVTELLDDIKEFQRNSEVSPRESFYCLQPIVVKKHNDSWELVDGQQRLTTILIILTYLKGILDLLGKSCYQLSYETRENSAEFLKHIDENRANENIDFYHIVEAKKAVDEWFKKQEGTYQIKFIQTLLNDNDTGKNVKVIWYQIGESENATEVFTRLNMGKIPLVNAELVKALFLKSSNFTKNSKATKYLQQLNIAQEWDVIEKRLQDDAFWYFVSNKITETNRIEFVLSLAARNLDDEGILDSDKLKVFLQFNRLLNEKDADIIQEWSKIKQCYMTLEEWFNDRALFHVIGYLVSQDVAIGTLFDLSQISETKHTFRQSLINLVLKKSFGYEELDSLPKNWIDEALGTLTYDSGTKKLRSILLLFNIASLLSNPVTNARFQFDKYKGDHWDIEHIRSVASEMPLKKEKQKAWLDNVISYISDDKSFDIEGKQPEDISKEQSIKKDAITLMNSTSFDNDQFEVIYKRVISHYDPRGDEDVDNSIGNLTLLDSSTNRSYKNAVFPIKRARIIALDKEATFVPLCTKNAFLKYYSKQVDKMLYWEPGDSQDHLRAMSEIILGFFGGKGVHQ